jgi:DNA-binding MarR family transcriptional regulator
MIAAAALEYINQRYPGLPPEAMPVYLLLCGHAELTLPGVARRLKIAQSTAARHLALLAQSGLAEQLSTDAARAPRWVVTPRGRALAESLGGV